MKSITSLFAFILLVSAASGVHAEDAVELEGISIIGNRELPKTITIVPWKKAIPGETLGRPVNSVLNNILQPIDREVFLRELGYYRQVNPLPAKN